MSGSEAWTASKSGDVSVLRLDDGKGNGYTFDVLNQLNILLDRAEGEGKSVILAGRPGFFSGGFDLETIKTGGPDLDMLLTMGAQTFARLLTYPLPVIAACPGHALAAGSLILLASDYRVGTEGDFKLGLHEVAIGSPLPQFLLELARYRLSTSGVEAMLRGETCGPHSALHYGYLDAVVPSDSVDETARHAAERLMRLRRGVFAAAKKAIRGEVAERMLADLKADVRLLNPTNEKALKARAILSSKAVGGPRAPSASDPNKAE